MIDYKTTENNIEILSLQHDIYNLEAEIDRLNQLVRSAYFSGWNQALTYISDEDKMSAINKEACFQTFLETG